MTTRGLHARIRVSRGSLTLAHQPAAGAAQRGAARFEAGSPRGRVGLLRVHGDGWRRPRWKAGQDAGD